MSGTKVANAAGKTSGMLDWYFKTNLLARILTGLALGAVIGIALGYSPDRAHTFVDYTHFFGDIFIRLLKMIVVPVIFLSLIVGASSIKPEMLGRVGVKTLVFYVVTTAIAVGVGLAAAHSIRPGEGFNVVGTSGAAGQAGQAPALSQTLLNIVPTNPAESLARGEVLPIIFFALVFGIALTFLKESKSETIAKQARTLFDVCSAGAECMYKIVGGIMQYAPVGVFVLIAMVFAQQGPRAIGPLLFVTLAVYIGLIAHLVVVYGGLLQLNGLSFAKFIKGANEAMITGFVTRSSNATLPVSMRCSVEKLGAPREISAFALPIGATINMNGTAIYIAVCAMFIGYAIGQPLNGSQQITVMLTATLAAVGTAGVPGAGALMLIMALESVGLKLDAGSAVAAAYAMVLGIDALLDMGRTSMNITGDICGVVIVGKSEKVLDMGVWKSVD